MTTRETIISIHHVDEKGVISLVAANVPYTNFQWNRRFSTCGDFAVQLVGPMPVEWPGRYLLTSSEHDEVGVVEKVESSEGAKPSCSLSGRFAESLWARRVFGHGGASLAGADWRQAVTSALASWHMPDIPEIILGEGTKEPAGKAYSLTAAAGDSAMERIYECTAANGSFPLVTYDRELGDGALHASIVTGVDRTREQAERPVCLFSVQMANISSGGYVGDFSCACSEVLAHAEDGSGEDLVAVSRSVPVPGFDAATQWAQSCFEDVSSLLEDKQVPTAELVDSLGGLRAYDHLADQSADVDVMGSGYREHWDLGDLVEVELPSAGLSTVSRIEEVREVRKESGVTIEASIGNKVLSRLRRAMIARR